jgi:hypothetical protein
LPRRTGMDAGRAGPWMKSAPWPVAAPVVRLPARARRRGGGRMLDDRDDRSPTSRPPHTSTPGSAVVRPRRLLGSGAAAFARLAAAQDSGDHT